MGMTVLTKTNDDSDNVQFHDKFERLDNRRFDPSDQADLSEWSSIEN